MTTVRKHSEQQTKQSRWGFRGMTVRDWLDLLVVPLALVGIGLLFEMQQIDGFLGSLLAVIRTKLPP